ncbi:MFS general substrate transporter [Punctularia strigosozonata HHB-11173 SS5]|uniref:MFS general substrate transporter n=1 Tax=Punctularia strigosozonata (strain HHB-11173) TaxID=741275 RepID=UPI0004417500|nr:MFS general substrate transporter [Punctularia strigosozonata HHB-11173 SS5]EIN14101.1 MFS general substrate transporter [Punctularia strigosozonata HHB-11173 SS5]
MPFNDSATSKADDDALPLPEASELYCPDVDTSHVDERRLLRKIDVRVIPCLAVLYLLNFLDRGAIGNAKLYHMEQDLHITDRQYLIALTVFFFPYALFEPASNVLLKSMRPSVWLSSLMLLWGIVMTLHGVLHNYGGLIGLRFLLGFFESGLYPGIVFYISCWYKHSELGTRVALFFSSATVAGAFSGLLAAAISNMDGVGGRPGWAWIFIIEGLVTVVCAVVAYWIVQDYPETARFLNEPQRVYVIRRLREDMQLSAGGEQFKVKYIWQSLKDWKTWIAMGIYMGFDGPLFAFSLFTPTIIKESLLLNPSIGFEATAANLLSVPVYAWACIVTVGIGMLGDRLGSRGYINLCLFGTGLVGYIILIASSNAALSYFAVYLAAAAWLSSNVEGSYKRSVTLAMAIGWGNLNGAVTSNVYRAKDAPWYRLGHGIVLAYIAIGWICSAVFMILLKRENKAREAGKRDEVIVGVDNKRADTKNGHYESVLAARRDKGDKWSGFRYVT